MPTEQRLPRWLAFLCTPRMRFQYFTHRTVWCLLDENVELDFEDELMSLHTAEVTYEFVIVSSNQHVGAV